jgi:serine/threonine-protein kinase ATR
VWSIVGHIVGLGDRHGENILVDTRSGDCVHVDFSCLFDKGLELEKPEMVPFRLTQNVVDALGVAGTEGAFGAVCENVLTVLRAHRDALMTVLDTFVHDPLLEWTRTPAAGAAPAPAGGEAAKSRDALAKIRSRLEGVVVGVGAAPSLPLSPAGQARRLIEEAMNLDNLGLMYIWWSAWF